MDARLCADLVQQGRRAFNEGAFYEAHELWEDAWNVLENPERSAVQGLIQIAAALHHLQSGRTRPTAALLVKGLEKLRGARPPLLDDLRIDRLVTDAEALLLTISASGSENPMAALPTFTL